MHIVNTIAPVFLVVALGAMLRRTGFVSADVQRGTNRLAYWVGLPCLLVVKISDSGTVADKAGMMMLVFLAATAGMIAVALVAAKWMGMQAARVGTFVQASFRGNLAFIGLPVVFFAFSEGPGGGDAAQSVAALAIGPIVVIYNVVAVVALLASEHRLGRTAFKKMGVGIATNPLLIACLVGLLLVWLNAATGATMPIFLQRGLDVAGQFALPLALLGVGGAVVATPLKGHLGPAVAAMLIKLSVGPALGLLFGWLLGADSYVTAIAMVMLTCPTAVASYVLVEQLKGDPPLAAGSIVLSTLGSAVAFSIVIATMT
ncbi:MAG: hypothetical protein GVY16_07170 [Planctomycetes bacterium]|jgi:predicted permease|nr:AEC family transporter [Phycisphaerae bacterium]NBB95506.1 hypothetical protein [Planctomycetota bacterium]